MERNELAVREVGGLVSIQMTTEQLLLRKKSIQELQSKVMTAGVDYGIIPGCAKPSLFKPGAETLNVTFGLRPVLNPEKDIVCRDFPNGHREYQVTIHILAAGSGEEIATGVGSCSTLETKWRYRNAERVCPKCGKPAIIKGRADYGGGWVCFDKKGGCKAKFADNDAKITSQEVGRVEHDNPADYYNTCLKMGKKRALVDGTINATAVSHIFTQDIEDMAKEIIKDAEYTPVQAPISEPAEKKPEAPAEVKGASVHTEGQAPEPASEKEKQESIIAWAMEISEQDSAKAEELFVAWGNFPSKKKPGETVSGKKNPFEYSGKWLDSVLGKAQAAYFAFKETKQTGVE